ncbi:hypothetical protein [Flammeovirga pacifica]|uniref:Uncharacterized protein n=1 Tax=Flammeovirga pacifica TaxID=915059 RepID=A0A1S1YXR2_FLAPC|nr:hypothetical protein [Flammeovirga pacifica]OHX65797.1 hypothetical protein NH26_05250 [Flammeovirga pacifica]
MNLNLNKKSKDILGVTVNLMTIIIFIYYQFCSPIRYTIGYVTKETLYSGKNPKRYKYRIGSEYYSVEFYSKNVSKKLIIEYLIKHPDLSSPKKLAPDSLRAPVNGGSWSYEEILELGFDIEKPFTLCD